MRPRVGGMHDFGVWLPDPDLIFLYGWIRIGLCLTAGAGRSISRSATTMFLLVEDTMQRVAAGRELLDLVDILDPGLSIFRGKGNHYCKTYISYYLIFNSRV